MKQIILIAVVILSFSSCKKEYTCVCKNDKGLTVDSNTWKPSKKYRAATVKRCDDQTIQFQNTRQDNTTCELY